MPRHGARVVRGRAHRAADERAVRQHQGRSRGTSGHRQDLPNRTPASGPAHRRLATDGDPDPRRSRAILRRHLLSRRAAPRDAVVPSGALRRGPALPGTARRHSSPEHLAHRGAREPGAWVRRPVRRDAVERRRAGHRARGPDAVVRPPARRFRRRAEVPPPDQRRSTDARLCSASHERRRRRGPRRRHVHVPQDVRRRPVRPCGRRDSAATRWMQCG